MNGLLDGWTTALTPSGRPSDDVWLRYLHSILKPIMLSLKTVEAAHSTVTFESFFGESIAGGTTVKVGTLTSMEK